MVCSPLREITTAQAEVAPQSAGGTSGLAVEEPGAERGVDGVSRHEIAHQQFWTDVGSDHAGLDLGTVVEHHAGCASTLNAHPRDGGFGSYFRSRRFGRFL